MRIRPGRAVAAGALCAAAATIAVWSGPLAVATGGLHAGGSTPTCPSASASASASPALTAAHCADR